MDRNAKWIWKDSQNVRNRWLRFRRKFSAGGQKTALQITADSAYFVFVNGEFVGSGPVRAYPEHWFYDEYDLSDVALRGENALEILCCHFGESNLKYILAPAGLCFSLTEGENVLAVSDENTQCAEAPEFARVAPKVSYQNSFFEVQYDARAENTAQFTPSVCREDAKTAHADLHRSPLPHLTRTLRPIKRVSGAERVEKDAFLFSADVSELMQAPERVSESYSGNYFIFFELYSQEECECEYFYGEGGGLFFVNGEEVGNVFGACWKMKRGKNLVSMQRKFVGNSFHTLICLKGLKNAEMRAPFVTVNFPFSETAPPPEYEWGCAAPLSAATLPCSLRKAEFLASAGDAAALNALFAGCARPIPHLVHAANVFAESYCERAETLPITNVLQNESELFNRGWAVVRYDEGKTVRLLFDFGEETVGRVRFTCDATAGTVLDFHNFEFIQPDGRKNLGEGMNNSFRYVCKEGVQSFCCPVTQGLRYSYLTVRNQTGDVRLKDLCVEETTYPQRRKGRFLCNDWKLNQIYECAANTLRCCSLDTYVDCPTYEQVFWVGDARVEALVDWTLNGDARLWKRCLLLAGQSLEKSPLVLSQAPSGWPVILSAWSFLWQVSCCEYYRYTGDRETVKTLFPLLLKNIEGIESHLNAEGLFDVDGWNMFDWADTDTPRFGVVTHQNFFAAMAVRETIGLAKKLGEHDCIGRLQPLLGRLKTSIDAYLFDPAANAYADCVRKKENGYAFSPVHSQQTHTAALVSGILEGERKELCKKISADPPAGFVRSGSPFFEFFHLQGLCAEENTAEFLSAVRKNWGFMVDAGADTFWEFWSAKINRPMENAGRLTRSHCHAWSSAPAYFFAEYVLGVRPLSEGYRIAEICPHCGDLTFAQGEVPTPFGNISVSFSAENGKIARLLYSAPPEIEIVLRGDFESAALI